MEVTAQAKTGSELFWWNSESSSKNDDEKHHIYNHSTIQPLRTNKPCKIDEYFCSMGLPATDITFNLGFEPMANMTSPENWLCSAQKSSKPSICAAISRPDLSVAPVSEIMKLLRCGIPKMMCYRPLSPTLLPLISKFCRKLMLLTIILQDKADMLLFLIYNSRKFLKHAILGISRMTSSSLRFLLLSSTVLLLRVNFTFFHQQIYGNCQHSQGLQISERDRLLDRLNNDAEDDLTTRSTPNSLKDFQVRLSMSILSMKRMAQRKEVGRSFAIASFF